MPEFVAVADSVKMFLDALKLSVNLNSINFGLMRSLEEATTFPDQYRRFLPGLKDAQFTGTGQADFADNANNELLYERLSSEGHIVSLGVGGAEPGDVAYFYKTSIERFDPIKGDPGAISMFDFSLKKYASAPVIRGIILSDGSQTFSTPIAPVATLASPDTPGNVDNGTHSYKQTFVNALGESAPGPKSNVITIADKTVNGQVTIPLTVGPEGTTARKLYRSEAGDAGPWKLQSTTANNNSGVVITDNVADASLGADAPSTGTYTGSTVVNLGAVPAGKQFYAVLHVIEAGTGNLDITVQSDDNAPMATPATVFVFTTATALTQELKNGSSNLQTHYRIVTTVSAGSGWKFFVAIGYGK